MSSLGKKNYDKDSRNYLIFSVFDMIDDCDFDYILIENVPKYLELYFPYNGSCHKLVDIIADKYGKMYNIESFVLNAKDFGVPQSRPRGFIKIWKKGLAWGNPDKQKEITLREAIGQLPSLEAGQDSGIKWHKAKPLNERYAIAMKHTPEGKSAFLNEFYYPRTANGTRMKGFHNTFARMRWDEPCPARAMNSGNIGSHNNAHPGRPLPDGTRSDARVLTLRELFIVSSLPAEWNLPDNCSINLSGRLSVRLYLQDSVKQLLKGLVMINLERSVEHRWTIDKNVSDKRILTDFAALMVDRKEGFTLRDLVDKTISQGRTHKPGDEVSRGSSITTGVRLLQAKYYMLGYDVNDRGSGQKKFMPSPMLLNCIETTDEVIQAKNFLVNLFSIQYPNPANRTPECFEIYAGRLIVKLLVDNRLNRRLYIDECIWFLPFVETINQYSYEELVESILEYRKFSYEQKQSMFEAVENWNYLFANVTHEINYYFLRLFKNMRVFNLIGDTAHNDGKLFRFLHSETEKTKTYRNTAYDTKQKISGYVTLSDAVYEAAVKLNDSFSAFDSPIKQSDEDIYNLQDWYTCLYEVAPLEYLACINTSVDRKSEIQTIVSNMVRASKYGSHDGSEFENALKPFMELFSETIEVEIIAGAGNTDLLCTMEEQPSKRFYKINVDAKTRGNALQELNASRLTRHIRKHGSEFCIVVAPRFAIGVRQDIVNSKVVVVRSDVLGNYCYLECTQSCKHTADFSAIRAIIDNNMGTDITAKLEELTVSRYAL